MAKHIRDHQLENYSNEDDYRPRKTKIRKFKDEDKVNNKKAKKV
jgi:hypothetical protein